MDSNCVDDDGYNVELWKAVQIHANTLLDGAVGNRQTGGSILSNRPLKAFPIKRQDNSDNPLDVAQCLAGREERISNEDNLIMVVRKKSMIFCFIYCNIEGQVLIFEIVILTQKILT